MTKLQEVISRLQTLPLEDQDRLADLLNDVTVPEEGEYSFSDEEWAEIKRRIETDKETYTVEEVLQSLHS